MSTNHDENSKEHHFIEAVKDSYLDQHVDRPTRVTKHNEPSLLDLLLTDKTLEPSSIEYISSLGKGDHTLLQAKFNLWTTRRSKERLSYNKGSYRSDLKNNLIYEDLLTLDQNWNKFKSTLDSATKKFIPKMKIRIKQHKLPMSSEVRDILRDEHKTWKDFKKEKSQRNYENYTSARNKVRKLTRQCVRKHEEDVSKSIKHQPKKFWNYVNKKIKTTETIPALKIGQTSGP